MSLLDLWRLIKRFWWLVIGLPVLFTACFYVYMLYGAQGSAPSYAATGEVVVSTGIETVAGIAKMETEQIAVAHPGVSASCSPDYNLNCLTITVKANDRDAAAEALAEVADGIVDRSRELLKGADPSSDMVVFDVVVDLSDPTAYAEGISKKALPLAPIAGLFVALLVIVITFLSRRPILGADDAEAVANAPVLDTLPLDSGGQRLVTNAGFLCDKHMVDRYCLIPMDSKCNEDLAEVSKAIMTVVQASGENRPCSILSGHEAVKRLGNLQQDTAETIIACCDSLQQSIDGARIARKSDVTILLIREWADSLRSLEAAIFELQLAGVSSIGLIYRPN